MRGGPSWTTLFTILLTFIAACCVVLVIVTAIDYTVDKKVGDVVKGYIYGMESVACYDANPCTRDVVLHDHTCVTPHRRYRNGYNCSSEDICYYPAANASEELLYPKYCCEGQCVSNRSRCRGICPTDGLQIGNASTCDYALFPLNYDLFQNITMSCLYGSCTVLTIQEYVTTDPLNNLNVFNMTACPTNVQTALAKGCIQHRCSISGDNASVYCVFRYTCATFDFGYTAASIAAKTAAKNKGFKSYKEEIAAKVQSIRSRPSGRIMNHNYKFPIFQHDKIPHDELEDLNVAFNAFMPSFTRTN